MTVVTTSGPKIPERVRIAITSPDILAQIRQVFASKNLAVEVVSLPYVEVALRPAASTATGDRSAAGDSLRRLVDAASRAAAPAPSRLCAEYRLNVIDVGDWPKPRQPAPAVRRQPASPPDPGADDPVLAGRQVAALSHRQCEVMDLVSRGVRNAEIAALLQVSEKTVKNHINRIFRSLEAGSRVEAVLVWQRRRRDGATRRVAPNPAPAPAGGRRPAHKGAP